MFLFQMISILLITITFYTYLADVIFSCDLDFKRPVLFVLTGTCRSLA